MHILKSNLLGAVCAFAHFLPVVAASSSVDAEFEAFNVLLQEGPPVAAQEVGLAKFLTGLDEYLQKVTSDGMAFYRAHPDDPRRWTIVLEIANRQPFFAKSFGPDVEQIGPDAAVVDEAAKAAWEEQSTRLLEDLLTAADSSLDQKERASFWSFAATSRRYRTQLSSGELTDARAAWETLAARLDEHVKRYAGAPGLRDHVADFCQAWKTLVPKSDDMLWQRYVQASDAELSKFAQEQLGIMSGREKIDLTFTAVDGRPVDLKQMRGKVVLVDFWATWCGPCIAELPNVKDVYARYRDNGFEVVGISLENANLLASDSPEKHKAKLEAAKKVLIDFTTKENMPWPQYFDGKFWKNDLAKRYGVQGIPAMFLIDQQGNIVSTTARGKKLEQEVSRLLKF